MDNEDQARLDRMKKRNERMDAILAKMPKRRCVVCGKIIDNDKNHHCTKKALCTYRSRMRKKSEAAEETRTFDDRLSEGFNLTKGNE